MVTKQKLIRVQANGSSLALEGDADRSRLGSIALPKLQGEGWRVVSVSGPVSAHHEGPASESAWLILMELSE
jgi:hypothetical protein